MTVFGLVRGLLLAVLIAILNAAPASANTIIFALNDHPDGNQNPPYEYGLRLDAWNLFFSFDGAATAQMVVDTTAMTAVISGTVIENDAGNDNVATWDLNYAFTGVNILGTDGSFTSTGGSGSLQEQGGLGLIDPFSSKQNGAGLAMIFTNELYRGFDGWNGRGWIYAGGTNDFLFTATVVPLPAALPLFGSALGLAGLFGWRRRRRAVEVV